MAGQLVAQVVDQRRMAGIELMRQSQAGVGLRKTLATRLVEDIPAEQCRVLPESDEMAAETLARDVAVEPGNDAQAELRTAVKPGLELVGADAFVDLDADIGEPRRRRHVQHLQIRNELQTEGVL